MPLALALRADRTATLATTAFETALGPIDRMRRWVLAALGPWLRPFLVGRELRVCAAGLLLVLGAFAGAAVAPAWMLVLGPVVWGVPHVVADARYLVLRPGLHRRPALWLCAGVPLVLAGFGGGARAGMVAVAGALLVARAPWPRRLAGAAVALALAGAAWRAGAVADVVFAHVHHFLTVAIWWAWRARTRRLHLAPLALFALGTAAVLLGAVPVPTLGAGAGGSVTALAAAVAPGLPLAWALRIVVLFAFAQAVHYGIWLRLVPEDDRPRATPRTFRQSARALRDDLGAVALVLAVVGAAAVTAWAACDLAAARGGYGRFALFHGYLELAAGALLWAEGRLGAGGARHASGAALPVRV